MKAGRIASQQLKRILATKAQEPSRHFARHGSSSEAHSDYAFWMATMVAASATILTVATNGGGGSGSPSTTTTQLESLASSRHFSSLRRHQTMIKYDDTKNVETLHSKYKVKWSRPLGEGAFGSGKTLICKQTLSTTRNRRRPLSSHSRDSKKFIWVPTG